MIEYKYIAGEQDDCFYKQILELRYKVFFEKLNLPKDIVIDEDESKAHHLACVDNEKLIGYCRLVIKEDTGWISQFVVEENYRHKGFGKKLLLKNEEKAGGLGANEIRLSAKIEALDFYVSLGYLLEGEVYPSRKTGLPHQLLKKKLL